MKKIECPMKTENIFPHGDVPVVDSEKLKEKMELEKFKDIVREIQKDFCGCQTEEKILKGIKKGYKLAEEEIIEKIDNVFKDYSLMSEPTWNEIKYPFYKKIK